MDSDYKIGASTSAFGLDWGVEFTTTGGYAASWSRQGYYSWW